MGQVYRARDTRLDREVALKVLPVPLAQDRQLLARFEREAKAVAALAHPNIIVIHDFGSQDGITFLVTELLEGQTLRERLKSSKLPWRKAVEYGAAIADGLAAAHERGIIHRDLKPENIFITTDDRLKILDFGVAQMQQPERDSPVETIVQSPGQTNPGVVMGTAAYMSPEQARAQTIDQRSDIFSLGCVVFEMIAGHRPFCGTARADTVAAILTEETPKLSDRISDIPPDLDQIVGRCLEKNREDRFQSASDLAFALRNVPRTSSGAVAPTSAGPANGSHLGRFWPLAGVVAVLAALALATMSSWRSSSPLPAPPRGPSGSSTRAVAVLPFASRSGDSGDYAGDGIAESLGRSLAQIHQIKVRPSTAVVRYRGRDQNPMEIGSALQVDTVIKGTITRHGDDCAISMQLVDAHSGQELWGGQYHRGFNDILPLPDDMVLAMAERLYPGLTSNERRRLGKRYTPDAEANRLYLLGCYYWNRRTPEGIKKAVEFFQKAIAKDRSFALAYAGLADCAIVATWSLEEPPLRAYREARASAIRALALDDSIAEAHAALAGVAGCCDWDWSAAEQEIRRSIELDPNYATAHLWYGRLLSAMRRDSEAISEMRLARQLDPTSLVINANLAAALLHAGQIDQALEQGLATVQMEPHFPLGHVWLGFVYERLGKFPEALREFQTTAQLFPGVKSEANLAWIYAISGKKSEARAVLERLQKAKEKGRYLTPSALAGVHAALGEKDRAFQLLDEACADRDPWLVDMRVDDTFALLRSDPRYAKILERMHFPP
jgi:serine/threonine-protein kinase